MSWLFGQTWLWYLIAFLVGVLLAWLFLVRPQQRRVRGLQGRDTTPPSSAEDDTVTLGSVPAAAAVGLGGAGLAAAAVVEHAAESGGETDPEPVTEQLPAVNPALSTLDMGTLDTGPLDTGSLDTGPLVALDKEKAPDGSADATPPAGAAAVAAAAAGAGAVGAAAVATHALPDRDDSDSDSAGSDTDTAPYGPGSARPGADGAAPGPEYTIKGNAGSKLYHAPESPYYVRTRAQAWFVSAEAAEAAGFQPWHRNRKRAAVPGTVAAPPSEAGPGGDSSA